MFLGKVIGSVVSTKKHEYLSGNKLLIVQPIDEDRMPKGEPVVAVDTVHAGVNDIVFLISGYEASFALNEDKFGAVEHTIIGIVDTVFSKKNE